MFSGASNLLNNKADVKEESSSSSRSSSAGVLTPNLSQIQNLSSSTSRRNFHARSINNISNNVMNKPTSSSTGGVKRKKDDPDGYSNHNHPPTSRRSLRPRIERSYAESPDIVVEFEEEPVKVNGNVNGCDEESDSDPGEMPPLPLMKVDYYNSIF